MGNLIFKSMEFISPIGEHFNQVESFTHCDFPFKKQVLMKIEESTDVYVYRGYSHDNIKPDFIKWVEVNADEIIDEIHVFSEQHNSTYTVKPELNQLVYRMELDPNKRKEFMLRFRICILNYYNDFRFKKNEDDLNFYSLDPNLDQYNLIFVQNSFAKLWIEGHDCKFTIDYATG